MYKFNKVFKRYFALFFLLVSNPSNANEEHLSEIIPLVPGPYQVASTNFQVEDAYSRISTDEMNQYLIGQKRIFGKNSYIDQILKYPESAWLIEVDVPESKKMYGHLSGESLPMAAFITYPTASLSSPNPYDFPYDDSAYGSFEHMLAPGETPQIAGDEKYPLLVLSHGASAHGVYDIRHANSLASHGYIVAVLFYGDNRLQNWLGNNSQMSFMRPLLTKAVINSLVESEEFGAHIQADNIGVSGHSFGGFTALALAGGAVSGNIESVVDKRVKATVLAAPWTGGRRNGNEIFPFGPDNETLARVAVPTISLFGTNDDITTSEYILPAMKKLGGPTYVVELVDQPHVFEGGSWEDRDNWELLFFNAYLKGDKTALEAINTGHSMQGGNKDQQLFDYQVLSLD